MQADLTLKSGRRGATLDIQLLILLGILVLVMAVSTALTPRFLSYVNMINVLMQVAMIMLTGSAAVLLMIAGAFDLLRTGRPGPIALSIPYDFLNARVEAPQPAGGHGARPPCHVADVEQAVGLLALAARPLVVAGGGVIAAGAERELQDVARRLGAPVVATVAGRGAVSERDPVRRKTNGQPRVRSRSSSVARRTAARRLFTPSLA